jgi:aminopeptidase N
MLRMLLFDFEQSSDARFEAMMRDFVDTHRGGSASTADFRAVAERHVGEDLGWFFRQWVDGTQLPDYRWTFRAAVVDGAHVARVTVRQDLVDDVPFRMPIPIAFELADGRTVVRRLLVEKAVENVEFALDARAVNVEFNVRSAVLCRQRREQR